MTFRGTHIAWGRMPADMATVRSLVSTDLLGRTAGGHHMLIRERRTASLVARSIPIAATYRKIRKEAENENWPEPGELSYSKLSGLDQEVAVLPLRIIATLSV
jgi:hypothetical protein